MLYFALHVLSFLAQVSVVISEEVILQVGRKLTHHNGLNRSIYNSEYETSINKLYQAHWNDYNGATYFWGWQPTLRIAEENSDTKFRMLLRFDNIHDFIPSSGNILESDVTLTFQNSRGNAEMEACFVTLPWDYDYEDYVRPKYLGTGWRFHRYNATGQHSLNWTEPGGWADCDSRVNISFTIPGDYAYHNLSKTFPIDTGLVNEWLQNGGATNYGLLIRAVTGSVALMSSYSDTISVGQKPALRIKYSTEEPSPVVSYPVQFTDAPKIIWVDKELGNDITGSGSELYPYASPKKGMEEAWHGDVVQMRSGVYAGSIYCRRSNVTLQSAPGHWAVIASSLHDPASSVNAISINNGVSHITLRNFEITGSFYYGVMVSYSSTASEYILLEKLRIHHTGTSCVKASEGTSYLTMRETEIHDCGARSYKNAHAFVGVQLHHTLIEDCYIHDLRGGAGIHLDSGTADTVIQRNYLSNVTYGMNIGFSGSYGSFDQLSNPNLYESLNSVIENNIIAGTRFAGVNFWAAYNARMSFNTLYNVMEESQSAIIIAAVTHTDAPGTPLTPSKDITIEGNILQKSGTAFGAHNQGYGSSMLHIRENALEGAEMPQMSFNNWYAESPTLSRIAHATFHDERDESNPFFDGLTGWSTYCKCETGSIDINPLLESDFGVHSCSPANSIVPTNLTVSVNTDYHGDVRKVSGVGAVSSYNGTKPFPPAVSEVATFTGIGARETHFHFGNYPLQWWADRECKDIYVDNVNGTDDQTYNRESTYVPFKTFQQAHTSINMCDRILLKGGQEHIGRWYIDKPNVTVMTNPADTEKAVLVCEEAGELNCIHVQGNVGGRQGVELTFRNFDIVIRGDQVGDCIRLNAGYGGGSLSGWDFFVDNSDKGKNYSRGYTLIEDISMSGCGIHGIKLSTFVTDVLVNHVSIVNVGKNGIVLYGGGNVTIRDSEIDNCGRSGIVLTGSSRDNLIERNTITNFGSRGILLGSRGSSIEYSDVDFANSPRGSWHDAINCTVRNNLMAYGGGPGVAFYSAKDMKVGHNTMLEVGSKIQGGLMLNLSPRSLADNLETLPPNENIIVRNNIITMAQTVKGKYNSIVNMRTLQGRVVQKIYSPAIVPPTVNVSHISEDAECVSEDGRRLSALVDVEGAAAASPVPSAWSHAHVRRQLTWQSQSFAYEAVNAPGTQGRNADGSCPHFPDSNLLNMRVDHLPVHNRSEVIKIMIGSRNMHAEFGAGHYVDGHYIPYGIPFITVNTAPPNGSNIPVQPMVPLYIDPITGYGSESDWPFEVPYPDDTPVQNAYLNCPDETCHGDRHSIAIDNSTCILYETFRTFSPNITGGNWSAANVAKFNLRNNHLRPLGYTSADAAGLPIHSGLVKFDEVINKGIITHAIRMTGPNSKEAYSLPATHFAPAGDTGVDSPWMGMRVRLKSTFNCSGMARASRVFCTALQHYGAIFCDNGASWDFGGEATEAWIPYKDELKDLTTISPADMEVLDSGCLCLDAKCIVADCGDGLIDPTIPPVFPPIADEDELNFNYNVYYQAKGNGKFKDKRRGSMGTGYKGSLQGWVNHMGIDKKSAFVDPLFATNPDKLGKLKKGSPAIGMGKPLDWVTEDFKGRPIAVDANGRVDVGVLF